MRHVQPWGALLLTFSFLPYALAFPCADHPLCDESCSCTGYHFKRLELLGDGDADHPLQGDVLAMAGNAMVVNKQDRDHYVQRGSRTQFYLDTTGVMWIRGFFRASEGKNHMKCAQTSHSRQAHWYKPHDRLSMTDIGRRCCDCC